MQLNLSAGDGAAQWAQPAGRAKVQTREEIKKATTSMIRTLITLTQTLNPLPGTVVARCAGVPESGVAHHGWCA